MADVKVGHSFSAVEGKYGNSSVTTTLIPTPSTPASSESTAPRLPHFGNNVPFKTSKCLLIYIATQAHGRSKANPTNQTPPSRRAVTSRSFCLTLHPVSAPPCEAQAYSNIWATANGRKPQSTFPSYEPRPNPRQLVQISQSTHRAS